MAHGAQHPPRLDRLASDGGRPRLLLLAATSATERDAVQGWIDAERAADGDAPVETVMVDDVRLAARLEQGDDPLLCPVGVVWLPPEHRGHRRARVRDLLSGRDPWHPRPAAQARILRAAPDRCEVVVADPARLSDLRRRFEADPGSDFAGYVRRQAALALERAERSLVGVQYKVPKLVYEEITDAGRFTAGAEALADRLGCDRAEVLERARQGLSEMVASQSRAAIDLWGQFGGFLARAHRIELDDDRVAQLRELGRRHSLVFLPSHRSYLDPLVLRPALLAHGLPPNHVIGGLNVSFWPIGAITRRSSYVFIRRSMRGDDVYKWTLQQYLAYLVRKRFNLELYIEGGRTRTGKLRPPKYGILSFLADGLRGEPRSDAYLVPTSITYEQLHEAGDMAAQARGAEKHKEDLPWLFGYARRQGSRLGRVHIRFGEPLSLREALGDAGAADAEDGDVRRAVQKTAFEVMHRINGVTPVTHTAIASIALLGSQAGAMTGPEVAAVCEELLADARRHDVQVTGDPAEALQELVSSGVVACFDGGTEPVYRVADDQHLVAAFYANSAVHAFLVRAVAELAQRAEDPDAAALSLRDLLKFEFFFSEKEPFLDAVRAEPAGLAPTVGPRVLRPLLEAHLVVSERLAARDGGEDVDADALGEECMGVVRQQHLQGRLRCAEAVSRELLDSAIKLADNRGLLAGGDGGARDAFRAEIAGWLGQLG